MSRTLDLGCGSTIKNPYEVDSLFGVDIVSQVDPRVVVADLVIEPIPFPDNYFSYVTAYDFLEHVPRILYNHGIRTQPFINIMNKIWRVLELGGKLLAHTPAYPKKETFSDPTHVNFISEDTVKYFCGGDYMGLSKSYGFNGMFELVSQGWEPIWQYHLAWELKAVK